MSSPAECKIPEEMRADLVEKMARAVSEQRAKGIEYNLAYIEDADVADAALTAIEPALAELVGALERLERSWVAHGECVQCVGKGEGIAPIGDHYPDCPFAPLSKYRRTT